MLRHLLLLTAAVWTCTAYGQRYTLNDVLSRIEQNNPQLQSYQASIKAANERAKGAYAWMPPRATTEWDMVPYSGDYSSSQLRFAVSQDFPNAQRNNARAAYLQSLGALDKYEANYKAVAFFAEAKEAYYKIYLSRRRIQVLQESNESMTLMINLAEKQLAITKGDLAAVYRLKARLAENETKIIHEQNAIRADMVTLNYLMNEPVDASFDIDTNQLVRNYRKLSSEVSMDSLKCARSDIMRMNAAIESEKLNRNYTALAKKPEFGLRLEHYEMLSGSPNRFSVMGMMTLPSAPWSARQYKSETRAMDYRITSMEQQRQNMVNMAMQNVKMYLIELESEYKEMDNYTLRIIPTYKKALDANLLAYGQNTTDMIMSLMAWDDLIKSEMEYLGHLQTYFQVQTAYEKAMQIR